MAKHETAMVDVGKGTVRCNCGWQGTTTAEERPLRAKELTQAFEDHRVEMEKLRASHES